jgi:hypothetical protein
MSKTTYTTGILDMEKPTEPPQTCITTDAWASEMQAKRNRKRIALRRSNGNAKQKRKAQRMARRRTRKGG